jgi:hypothetical protein
MSGGAPKSEQRTQQQSWANLGDIFGTAKGAAQNFGTKASTGFDDVTKYFKSLLGGDRTATAQAVAPAANAARASSDAAKQERASAGTGRTGGDVAENVQSEDKLRSQVMSLIGALGPQAATALQSIAGTELGAMLSSLGIGVEAAGTAGSLVGSDINSRRAASADMWSSLIGGAFSIPAAIIGKPS